MIPHCFSHLQFCVNGTELISFHLQSSSSQKIYYFFMMIDVFLQEIAFYDITRTGELLSRLSEDTQIIKNAATTNLSEALRNLSTAFIGLAFMFATSWKLTCKHLILKAVVLLVEVLFTKSGINLGGPNVCDYS